MVQIVGFCGTFFAKLLVYVVQKEKVLLSTQLEFKSTFDLKKNHSIFGAFLSFKQDFVRFQKYCRLIVKTIQTPPIKKKKRAVLYTALS